ncbi:hypothetical protein GGH94_001776 [Coemansia aciculifera]|uniref:RGS domain-containing protein n=1 Tax=Coemansia aciculifera TaxID=417176 RepID=A0A9W8M7B8_9FUNG|nr:hypothetical protein GGH94_001776 [Coemansia aciculifera]
MNRSIPLVVVQAIAGLIAGTLSLAGSALHEYPCAIKLWAIYPGVVLWLATVTARAVQRCFLFQRLPGMLGARNVGLIATPNSAIKSETSSADSSPQSHSASYRPDTGQTLYTWSEFGPLGMRSQSSLVRLRTGCGVPACQARYGKYFADNVLLVVLVLFGVLLGVVALAITTRSPSYMLLASNTLPVCRDSGWELWPAYGAAIACTGLLFPALIVWMWSVRDPYGARTDILGCMVIAQVAMALFVLWQTILDKVREYVSELLVVWLAVAAGHISSVCWPLLRSARHQHQLANQPSQAGLCNLHKGPQLRRSLYLPLYGEFNRMMEDSKQRHLFLLFTAQNYSTAIPAFLDDFQMLKYKTIDSLRQGVQSQLPSNDAPDAADIAPAARSLAQLEEARSPIQMLASVRKSLEDHSLAEAAVPVTKGIFESAMLALPPLSVDQNTRFPEAVKSSFASFTYTYFSTGSYMSINIPREVVEDIQNAIEENNIALSVLDKAKDEVLFLLCTDVYSGYRKRVEARNAVSRAAKTTS